jgi:putative methionine-R-sulfoxide reductase with GAF domain
MHDDLQIIQHYLSVQPALRSSYRFLTATDQVVGTIDVESARANAFNENTESLLIDCADAIAPLWAAS